MRGLRSVGQIAMVAIWWNCLAQDRTVAITVDDLPFVAANDGKPTATAEAANRNLLAAFEAHHVPVTGFVIQKNVGTTIILEDWISRGFDLGNHTYSHPDIDGMSLEEVEREIVLGESTIRPLMRKAGKELRYFRFPMNHTGATPEQHDALAVFLRTRGYEVATCTIDTSDYLFNRAYVRMLAAHDAQSARKLRAEYLAYSAAEIDYYASLNKQVLGYQPPEVMLLHDNQLNADAIDDVLKLFEDRRYRFVSLEAAQSDAAYRIPDTYITKFGPMWGYRWAAERHVKVNGKLEKDPPQWVLDYPMQ